MLSESLEFLAFTLLLCLDAPLPLFDPGFPRRASRGCGLCWRRMRPSRCIRHDMSAAVSTSVPACSWSWMRSLPIMQDTASSFTANVPAEAAAFIGALQFGERDALHRLQQSADFVDRLPRQLARGSQPQFPQPVATLVQTHLVRKSARDFFHLQAHRAETRKARRSSI